MTYKKNIIIALNMISFPLLICAADDLPVVQSEINLFELIFQGGWAMWPLGLCSLFMLFLVIYSFEASRRKRFVPDEIYSILLDKTDLGREQIQLLINNNDSILCRCLRSVLERKTSAEGGEEDLESLFLDEVSVDENTISTWINYLNVIATVSPMIGLLGTVSGMIGAFQTIGSGGMGRPELLAGDIGSALITTAAGLIIGIPAMLFYFVLKARLTKQFIFLVQTANKIIDLKKENL